MHKNKRLGLIFALRQILTDFSLLRSSRRQNFDEEQIRKTRFFYKTDWDFLEFAGFF